MGGLPFGQQHPGVIGFLGKWMDSSKELVLSPSEVNRILGKVGEIDEFEENWRPRLLKGNP